MHQVIHVMFHFSTSPKSAGTIRLSLDSRKLNSDIGVGQAFKKVTE